MGPSPASWTRKAQVELIREPRLADNFRFTLPIPGKEPWQTIEANYICGKQQKLSSFDASAKKLTLHWNKPLLNYLGESFDASAAMGIELTPHGVLFSLRIDNPTRYQIGEVFFPLIGGIQGIGKTGGQLKATELITPTSREAVSSTDIFRVFTNMSWLGDQGPEQYYSYPEGHAAAVDGILYAGSGTDRSISARASRQTARRCCGWS